VKKRGRRLGFITWRGGKTNRVGRRQRLARKGEQPVKRQVKVINKDELPCDVNLNAASRSTGSQNVESTKSMGRKLGPNENVDWER
jgi:hypothetical protein